MQIKCADCGCFPSECRLAKSPKECPNCTWESCCCKSIHQNQEPSVWSKFFGNIKRMYLQALGIEILCIAFAELGQNSSFLLFGYNHIGVITGYIVGYALAGFATLVTILGRYDKDAKSDACCNILEHYESAGLGSTLKMTLQNFANGIKKITKLANQPDWQKLVKSSIYILITAESVCILTAMTVDLIFYRNSLLLSIPLSLAAGALAIVVPEAYRRAKISTSQN